MTAEPTNAERIRRLPWLIAFDALNSMWRQMRREAGTVAARALERLGGRLERHAGSPASAVLERGVQSLARDDFDAGTEAVAELISLLKLDKIGRHQSAILKDCAHRLRGDSKMKLETLPLALHCINEVI